MSTDRHRILECSVCKKRMRSDSYSLKRHGLKKHKNFNFQVTTIVRTNVKGSGNPSNQDLESEIVANNKLEKIELGEKISKVLTNTSAKEESLSKQHKEAFDLYQSRKFAINLKNDIKLYPWQQQAMDLMQKPTHQQVI